MVGVKRVTSSESKNLIIALKHLKNVNAKVGWFPSATYDDDKKTPVAGVAAQNEYGNPAKHIPARPFLRPTIQKKQKDWRQLIAQGSKNVIEGEGTINDVMDLLASTAVGDIQKTISLVLSPPLAPQTIQARINRKANKKYTAAITKPLIDTGKMFTSISYEIEGTS